MMADATQLNRWLALLRAHSKGSAGATSAEPLSQRGRLIANLPLIDAVRHGGSASFPQTEAMPLLELPALASKGSAIALQVWDLYAGFVCGDRRAEPMLERAILCLNPTALNAGPDDNPEPWWQNEMVILHALHSFALIKRDPVLLDKTLRCAQFHLEEIQPDHATNEPWAIHAYATHADGTITAETLLHAGLMQGSGTLSVTSQLILHDATFTLEAFLGS